jgi:hypothetical protein
MENLISQNTQERVMHKLAFSVGLILLIAFSVFSPLQIMKIETANAQVTVPKTYVQTVNDPYIKSPYAWENFTTGLDPDSYSHVPGVSLFWYDWKNITIGTSYGPYGEPQFKNWTIQNHSSNNDSVLICLGGGQFGYCHPAIETFDPFSEYLTVITHVDTLYYWSFSWIKPLADALRTMGFTYVHFLGFSSGAMGVASYLCHYDEGVLDSGIVISGYLNQSYTGGYNLLYLANYAYNVTTPVNIITPTSDIPPLYGNGYIQAHQFYDNLSPSLTKEIHDFDGGHVVFWYYEVGTGKTAYEVVGEWVNASYPEEFGTFTAYAKRVGADEWGDCIARQGYYPHLNSYCLDWDNKIIKPMVHYPYIPADIGNDQIILQATGKHSAPTWYGNWPSFIKSPWGPTIGGTIMLYFNLYVHDNLHDVDKWLFNFHEPNPWAGPNMFVLEIFMTRWVVPMNYPGVPFQSVPPGYWGFEAFFSRSTHDNDLHLITCPFEMPVSDQWYYFLYDVGNKLHDAKEKIELWSMGGDYIPAYTVLGFQLMTIAMGAETIGGSWTFQFGDISLTDFRWGTGSAYQNSATYQLKTRADGNQRVPRLNGSIGLPSPLRPYVTYTNTTLDSDINNDGSVTGVDLARLLFKYKYASREQYPYSYPFWDYSEDIIPDGTINGLDISRFLIAFQEPKPTEGLYQSGLGSMYVWMTEMKLYGGDIYWPDPPPGYVGPPWTRMRTTPYTCHLYLETWDVIDWPDYVCRTINYNPCINYMGRAVFYNGTTLNQTGTLTYAYNYPIHD